MQDRDPFLLALHRWTAVFMVRSMRDAVAYSRESGLSMPQLGALFEIRRRGCSGVTDLGEDLGVSSSAASQMLERLVQQELIRRTEDPIDRRVKQVVLTDKGLQVLQESVHARDSWLLELAATLSDAEKKTVTAALDILIDHANRLMPPIEAGR